MRKRTLNVVLVLALALTMVAPAGALGAPVSAGAAKKQQHQSDFRMDPLTAEKIEKRSEHRAAQIKARTTGRVSAAWGGDSKPVNYDLLGTGKIWTVLGEFSDLKHNQIPKPAPGADTGVWVRDFNRPHYQNLFFGTGPKANSMANYYKEQSSGRYTVAGDVTDWVTVPGTAVSYDDTPYENVWNFLVDSLDAWYAAQKAAGKTDAEISAYLAQFDVEDVYDYDQDGNLAEPDGYIDHFQSVHAGEGEDDGGGALGTEAIWSHSWYAYYADQGITGPEYNLAGGIRIGNTDYWVGKYTMEPENGGLGVFAHEYAHDIGIPDLYDYYGENGTGFWTLMSAGSWLEGGARPGHLGAWEKAQMGWLNYQVVESGLSGVTTTINLNPAEYSTAGYAQAAIVSLPDKEKTFVYGGAPYAGSYFYFGGEGPRNASTMTRAVTVAGESATFSAKVRYEMATDLDYFYLQYSTGETATTPDGFTSELWYGVETNLSTTTDPNYRNFGYGITGSSNDGWVDLTATIPASGDIKVRIGVVTREQQPDAPASTLSVDDIVIDGGPVDGAETDTGWEFFMDFTRTTGSETVYIPNYYIAEYRTYWGYDAGLKSSPLPYAQGLLISYYNGAYGYWDWTGNSTTLHPGEGFLLPVDSHPKPLKTPGGQTWSNIVQTYDATFGPWYTPSLTLDWYDNTTTRVKSQSPVTTFDDTKSWWDASNPTNSVITPNTNTTIKVEGVNAATRTMKVTVKPSKPVAPRK